MPTYTYKCKKCSHSIDIFHAMSAKRRIACPKCGSSCRRMIGSGAGIIFKGSGFYETDYRRSSKPGAADGSESKSESKAEAKSESKSESKAEAKPESKTEAKSESKSESKTESKPAKKAAGAD